ncbi:Csu type fimbrial protein [Lysobacter sp. A3-1-A15]|uniref:Csu type fimbrial protein n=1 Tax=Novilysobacter viscosus TaxID=3098602 RepID=UPI002EDADDC8
MILRSVTLLALLVAGAAYAPNAMSAVTCTSTESPMNYGDVALPVDPVTTTMVISVTCDGNGSDKGESVRVCIGLNTPQSPRRMAAGGQFITHRLYRDPAYSEEINYTDVNPERVVVMPDSKTFTTQLTIYGRLQGNSAGAGPGPYSEVISGALGWSTTAPTCSTVPARRPVSFTASARGVASCDISADDLSFGTRAQLASAVNANTSLGVSCTVNTPYTVRMDGGTTANNVADRRMGLNGTGPAAQGVAYQLRHTSANGPLWGDGTAGTTTVAGTGTGGSQTLPVYGVVPPQPVPLPGSYQDTVTVTVQY